MIFSKTEQLTTACFVSGFGWGLTRRIENHGLNKFKANIQRVSMMRFMRLTVSYGPVQSREGLSLVLRVLRESRLQALGFGPEGGFNRPYFPFSKDFGAWQNTYDTAGAWSADNSSSHSKDEET